MHYAYDITEEVRDAPPAQKSIEVLVALEGLLVLPHLQANFLGGAPPIVLVVKLPEHGA